MRLPQYPQLIAQSKMIKVVMEEELDTPGNLVINLVL